MKMKKRHAQINRYIPRRDEIYEIQLSIKKKKFVPFNFGVVQCYRRFLSLYTPQLYQPLFGSAFEKHRRTFTNLNVISWYEEYDRHPIEIDFAKGIYLFLALPLIVLLYFHRLRATVSLIYRLGKTRSMGFSLCLFRKRCSKIRPIVGNILF